MTSEQLIEWRKRLNMKKKEAAQLLSCHYNTIARYERGDPIPKYIALACSAILLDIPEYGKHPSRKGAQ